MKPLDNVCSYCRLQEIREAARMRGKVVRVRQSRSPLGGVDIYVTPEGLDNNKMIDPANHDKYWRAWFQATQDLCCC